MKYVANFGVETLGYRRHHYYTVAYNRQRVRPAEVPSNWDDLLDSRWQDGKVALDPRAFDWFFGMLSVWGRDRGGEFMRRFSQHKPAPFATATC